MNRSVSASAPPVTAVAEEGASAGTRSAPPGRPASVDEQRWQRSLPLVVQAGALDAVGFVLLCQGERWGDGIRDCSALQFRVPRVSGGLEAQELTEEDGHV
jgi:hypothetical protein